MERIFSRRAKLGENLSSSATIYKRDEDDERPQAVQVCFDLSGVCSVQAGITFYSSDPVELFKLAEMLNQSAVALTYAQKYESKAVQ